MIRLEPKLIRHLEQLQVRIEEAGPDVILLRNVPADRRRFNKSHTNLLIGRSRPGVPCLVGVDADLEYTGRDAEVVRLFAAGHRRQGWRLFFLGGDSWTAAVEQALSLLGQAPDPTARRSTAGTQPVSKGGVLVAHAVDLSALALAGQSEPTIGRAEQIGRLCLSLLGWKARFPVIVGEAGVGKSNLLHAMTRRLAEIRESWRVLQVDLGVLTAGATLDSERENLLAAVLREASQDSVTVLALERLEQGVAFAPRGRFVLAQAIEQGSRLVGTVLPEFLEALQVSPLARHLDIIQLDVLDPGSTHEVLRALCARVAQHHQVEIDAAALQAVVDRSLSLAGPLPAKAITLLDAAAARASLAGAERVDLYHVYSAAADFPEC